jgi:hypothetical protein
MNEENHGKRELGVVDDPAEIRIIHLPNTSQKSYTSGYLLGSVITVAECGLPPVRSCLF